MGSSNRKIRRRKRLKKLRRNGLIVVLVAFVAWLFYVGATWGPGPANTTPNRAVAADTTLVEESERLAGEFETVAAVREPSATDLDILRDAIAARREYNLSTQPSPQDRKRQEELEKRLNYFLAKEVFARSEAAEKEAEEFAAAGDATEAVSKIQIALELQREVNQRYGRNEFRSTPRETRLQQQVLSMEVQPLHARSLELEKNGLEAIEEQRWSDARQQLAEARDLQVRINAQARRSAYYDAGRQERLNSRLASVSVGETMSEVHNLQAQAVAEEEANEWGRAAQLYERAMMLQNEINRDHPQSAFVSTERVAELDRARQTALSTPQARELEEAVSTMRQALASGNPAAASAPIRTGARLVAQLFDRFPQSAHLDQDLRLELDFLSIVEADLGELQALLRENLRPVPGQSGWMMTAAPVSQQTYTRVMNRNPSRNIGPDLPVDSVALPQAREFCRRASWILARRVQLPSRQQFEAAVGDQSSPAYADASWHKGNSGGTSKPVSSGTANPHGFLHLMGNLRQWVSDEGDESSVWVAGMSYEDDFPQEELFRQANRNERTRTVGFRYVVSEEVPSATL